MSNLRLQVRPKPKAQRFHIPKTFAFDKTVEAKDYFDTLDKEAISRLVDFPDLAFFQGYRRHSNDRLRQLLKAERKTKQVIPDYLKEESKEEKQDVLEEVYKRVTSSKGGKRSINISRGSDRLGSSNGPRGHVSDSRQGTAEAISRSRKMQRFTGNEVLPKKNNFTRNDIILQSKDLFQEISPLDNTQDILDKTNSNMITLKKKLQELKKEVKKPNFALENRHKANMIRISQLVYDIDIDETQLKEALQEEEEEIEDAFKQVAKPKLPDWFSADSKKVLGGSDETTGKDEAKGQDNKTVPKPATSMDKRRTRTRGQSREFRRTQGFASGMQSPVSQSRMILDANDKEEIQRRFKENWTATVERPITRVLGQVVRNVAEHGMMDKGEKSYVINTLTEAKFKKALIRKGEKLLKIAISNIVSEKRAEMTSQHKQQDKSIEGDGTGRFIHHISSNLRQNIEDLSQPIHRRAKTSYLAERPTEKKPPEEKDEKKELFEMLKDKVVRKLKDTPTTAQEMQFYEKNLQELKDKKRRFEQPKLPTYSVDERFRYVLQSVL